MQLTRESILKMTTFKLEKYINFESLQELNHHVSLHVKNNELNDTQYRLLTILSQHSCKYYGASYLKNNTLAGLLNMSKRSIQRNLKKLVDLGIIQKVFTLRPVRGGSGSNIFVIQEYKECNEVTPSESSRTKLETSSSASLLDRLIQEETTSSKSLIPKYLVTKSTQIDRQHNINYLDIVPSHIPTKLGEFAIKFFNSADVNRLYYSMNKALEPYHGRIDYDSERLTDLMHKGIRALVSAIKNNYFQPKKYSKVRNIFSYASASVLKIAVTDEFEDLHLYK